MTLRQELLASNLPPCPTLWDAISDLPELGAGEGSETMAYTHGAVNDYQRQMRGSCTEIHNHQAMKHSKRMVERFKAMKWGESTIDVPDELKPLKRNGNGARSSKIYGQNNRRMYPFKQCQHYCCLFLCQFCPPIPRQEFHR